MTPMAKTIENPTLKTIVKAISYQSSEAKVLEMEDWLMQHNGYNRSQLHKQLVREKYQMQRMMWHNEKSTGVSVLATKVRLSSVKSKRFVLLWWCCLPPNVILDGGDRCHSQTNAWDWNIWFLFTYRRQSIVNPFQKIKDEVVISMLKQVAKKRRLSPEKMIEVLVHEAYRNLR